LRAALLLATPANALRLVPCRPRSTHQRAAGAKSARPRSTHSLRPPPAPCSRPGASSPQPANDCVKAPPLAFQAPPAALQVAPVAPEVLPEAGSNPSPAPKSPGDGDKSASAGPRRGKASAERANASSQCAAPGAAPRRNAGKAARK